jgi:hypothetical protein
VGPRVSLDAAENRRFFTLPGIELRPLGRPASRYAECAIPALTSVTNDFLLWWHGKNVLKSRMIM